MAGFSHVSRGGMALFWGGLGFLGFLDVLEFLDFLEILDYLEILFWRFREAGIAKRKIY